MTTLIQKKQIHQTYFEIIPHRRLIMVLLFQSFFRKYAYGQAGAVADLCLSSAKGNCIRKYSSGGVINRTGSGIGGGRDECHHIFLTNIILPRARAKHNLVRSMMQRSLHSRTALLCGTGRPRPIAVSDGGASWFTHRDARECGSLEPAQRQRESRPRRASLFRAKHNVGSSGRSSVWYRLRPDLYSEQELRCPAGSTAEPRCCAAPVVRCPSPYPANGCPIPHNLGRFRAGGTVPPACRG